MSGDKKTGSILRTTDVAHILDCTPDKVILLARKGIIPATKQGRVWRFEEKDVRAYMKRMAK